MKDYEEKVLNIMDSAKDNIRIQLDKAYKSGYEDAKSELGQNAVDLAHEESDRAYQQGLQDAWEAAKKLVLQPNEGGLSFETIYKIFDKPEFLVLENVSASEAISKIKEYEEQQKQATEIKIGDGVITKIGNKGVVIAACEDGTLCVWFSNNHVQMYPLKDLSKTSRHFDQIAEVLAEMRGESE